MIIVAAISGALALFVVIAATRRSVYDVERTIEIAARPDAVYATIADLERFAGVYVLFGEPLDPAVRETFSMTLEDSVPDKSVRVKLVFTKPMKSTATCAVTVAPSPAGSAVTWSLRGHHNFVGRAAGMVVNMDKMIGGDIEKSLARLKRASE